jgi:uncharacterized protein YkwD
VITSISLGGFARLALLASLAALVAVGVGPLAHPSPVAAGTAETMEASLLSWTNAERAKRGLVPLKLLSSLVSYSGGRAATMASSGLLRHPSCLGCELSARSIQNYSNGEAIAWTTWPWGSQAAQSIFNGWKGSTGHWALLMSNRFNYVGFGVAYRSSGASSWAAAVLTESVDQTNPWARMSTGTRKGSTVTWTWLGNDTTLQTHTSGFKNFDIQYRVGTGAWSTIRSATTTTSLSLTGRASGHYYGLRVRARDNRGYVSSYSAELRVWVP